MSGNEITDKDKQVERVESLIDSFYNLKTEYEDFVIDVFNRLAEFKASLKPIIDDLILLEVGIQKQDGN